MKQHTPVPTRAQWGLTPPAVALGSNAFDNSRFAAQRVPGCDWKFPRGRIWLVGPLTGKQTYPLPGRPQPIRGPSFRRPAPFRGRSWAARHRRNTSVVRSAGALSATPHGPEQGVAALFAVEHPRTSEVNIPGVRMAEEASQLASVRHTPVPVAERSVVVHRSRDLEGLVPSNRKTYQIGVDRPDQVRQEICHGFCNNVKRGSGHVRPCRRSASCALPTYEISRPSGS